MRNAICSAAIGLASVAGLTFTQHQSLPVSVETSGVQAPAGMLGLTHSPEVILAAQTGPVSPYEDEDNAPVVEAADQLSGVANELRGELARFNDTDAEFDKSIQELRDLANGIKTDSDEVKKASKDIKDLVAQQSLVAGMPMPAACNCKCPTIDEIRAVVREELEAVSVTVRSTSGDVKTQSVRVSNTGKSTAMQIQPGEVVVAIDGQPVQPFVYQSQVVQGPVTAYETPAYQMRTYQTGGVQRVIMRSRTRGRLFGGVTRGSTCTVDPMTGATICN